MKTKNIIYSLWVAVFAMMFTACTPDDYSLGSKELTSDDIVEGLAYSITHDESNPNIVYLKSLLPSKYSVMWETPSGRYNGQSEVTLKMPFAGTYTVQMGVETSAGYVYGPETTFTIDDFCSDFVSDELWTYLTGGAGSSKKWYLDIDSKAQCRYFVGPLYFYGTADNWNSVTLGQTISGDSWSWAADWAGNGGWLFGSTAAMDYGYMEFNLIDGANVIVEDLAAGKHYEGTFVMDTDNHTMSLSDAPVLHDPGREAIVSKWGNVTILALTEDHMQLAVLRDQSDEGNCLLSYNFISEEYRDNWTPDTGDDTTVEPTLASDWRDYVEPKTSHEMTYKLSDENPFDWCNLDGTNKNITTYSAVSGVEDLTLVMNSATGAYSVTTPAGDTYEGTYTLSDKGVYTFSSALPVVQLSQSGNCMFKSNADNTLRIMSYTTDDYTGSLKDLWLGANCVDDQGELYQYMAYHFVLQTGGSTGTRYTANLYLNNSGWGWTHGNNEANYQSDNVYVTGDGDYTCSFVGSESDVYLIYLDIKKILKDNPNCDVTIKDIKVDGTSISFNDANIDKGTGDDATTFRRYILNPWQSPKVDFPDATVFNCSSSIDVTFTVKMDTGAPVVTASSKKYYKKH